MQGIAEAIKYLYQQFILRDVVAYVAPGAILATCLLSLHFADLDSALKFLNNLPSIAYVPIYGLLFTIGLGIQNFGELIKLLKDHVRKGEKGRSSDEVRFDKLQEFHRAVLSSQVSHQMINEYSEVLERTRERIEVKKYASGNIALALVMGAVVILFAKLSLNAGRWATLAIGTILVVSLIRANRWQAGNVKTWEDAAIQHHQEKNLKV